MDVFLAVLPLVENKVIICRLCGYEVIPVQIEGHLRHSDHQLCNSDREVSVDRDDVDKLNDTSSLTYVIVRKTFINNY